MFNSSIFSAKELLFWCDSQVNWSISWQRKMFCDFWAICFIYCWWTIFTYREVNSVVYMLTVIVTKAKYNSRVFFLRKGGDRKRLLSTQNNVSCMFFLILTKVSNPERSVILTFIGSWLFINWYHSRKL